ncbi:MAG: CRISPR-associated endonuclease Cas3'', partial [Clostridiales bacterium]|nr:CRISPR-associated endonuclease Cas3'' [Clostridiales bacterium]
MLINLFGKNNPPVSLHRHLLDTGYCMRALWTSGILKSRIDIISECISFNNEETISVLAYIAAMHDIGKAHPCFQVKLGDTPCKEELLSKGMVRENTEYARFRHEIYSKELLKDFLKKRNLSERTTKRLLSDTVALHHQSKSTERQNIPNNCCPSLWEEVQIELEKIVFNEFNPPLDRIDIKNISVFSVLLLGSMIL